MYFFLLQVCWFLPVVLSSVSELSASCFSPVLGENCFHYSKQDRLLSGNLQMTFSFLSLVLFNVTNIKNRFSILLLSVKITDKLDVIISMLWDLVDWTLTVSLTFSSIKLFYDFCWLVFLLLIKCHWSHGNCIFNIYDRIDRPLAVSFTFHFYDHRKPSSQSFCTLFFVVVLLAIMECIASHCPYIIILSDAFDWCVTTLINSTIILFQMLNYLVPI